MVSTPPTDGGIIPKATKQQKKTTNRYEATTKKLQLHMYEHRHKTNWIKYWIYFVKYWITKYIQYFVMDIQLQSISIHFHILLI